MSKTDEARAFFTDVDVVTTVKNTYRPALNGTRRRITRLGNAFFDATLLDDTTDGDQKAGTDCRGHIPTRASEVIAVSAGEAMFRLGPPGTPLYEHYVTYRIQSLKTDEIVNAVLALPDEQEALRVGEAVNWRLRELRAQRPRDLRRVLRIGSRVRLNQQVRPQRPLWWLTASVVEAPTEGSAVVKLDYPERAGRDARPDGTVRVAVEAIDLLTDEHAETPTN